MDIDLSVPIWTIEHVAAALHLKMDTAREDTDPFAFSAPRAGFGRNLWARAELLAWFAALPDAEKGKDRKRASVKAPGTVAGVAVAPAPSARDGSTRNPSPSRLTPMTMGASVRVTSSSNR